MADRLLPLSPRAYTYADPYLSLWQSAAAEVQSSQPTIESLSISGVSAGLMTPVHEVYTVATEGLESATELFEPEVEPEGVVQDCAKLASRFLWAEITGNREKAQLYADELKKAVCDAGGWSTCITRYLKFKAEGGKLPYRADMNTVLPLEGTTIAVIGDWGTGEHAASHLLGEIQKHSPDLIIHLGDIYYSGTKDEVRRNFLAICRTCFGNKVPVFSICGNHDMYSGGEGYYWLLDQLGQKTSYFCLRNDHWQILAMDTGHNDHNPFTVATNMTSINSRELVWLKNNIAGAGARRTILMSHHQLFSAFGPVGRIENQDYAYNNNLYDSLKDILPSVEWWFWGHEHNLAVYLPYMGLKRGRCLGCSGVPVLLSQQSYRLQKELKTSQPADYPQWRSDAELGNNGTDYNHAFAIVELKSDRATVEYYQAPVGGKTTLLFSE